MTEVEKNEREANDAGKKSIPFFIINARKIAHDLREGTSVLLKTASPVAVTSAATGKPFSGINQIIAQQNLVDRGLNVAELITYDQAKRAGTFIKKGADKPIVLSVYDAEKRENKNYFYFTKHDTAHPEKFSEKQKQSQKKITAIECNSSDPDKFIGHYLAASYLGVEFKAEKGVRDDFASKVNKQLDQALETKQFHKVFELGNKASKVSKEVLNGLSVETKKQELNKEIKHERNSKHFMDSLGR